MGTLLVVGLVAMMIGLVFGILIGRSSASGATGPWEPEYRYVRDLTSRPHDPQPSDSRNTILHSSPPARQSLPPQGAQASHFWTCFDCGRADLPSKGALKHHKRNECPRRQAGVSTTRIIRTQQPRSPQGPSNNGTQPANGVDEDGHGPEARRVVRCDLCGARGPLWALPEHMDKHAVDAAERDEEHLEMRQRPASAAIRG